MTLAPGSPARLGRYEVIGLLATGGMAEVHLGRLMGPSGFERVVVLKRILPHLAREAAFVDMFLDEARIVAKINHPNVIQVSELGRDGDELYLAMELIEGESLGGFMRRHWASQREIGFELAAFIIAEACAGLHAAHELTDDEGKNQEIVHRDVSPQNLMISYAGRVKVLDFGIAKAVDRAARTRTGELKGKVEYMSPEQCRAEPLDRRSDVFALGVLLYELSVSKRLFRRAGELASLRAVCEDPIASPSSVVPGYPEALERICVRALARDRAQRYDSAEQMRRDLVAYLRSTPNVGLHEEALGQRMQELFADRLEHKRELLKSLRSGATSTRLPAPEVDLQVVPPIVPAATAVTALTTLGAGATSTGAPAREAPSASHGGSGGVATHPAVSHSAAPPAPRRLGPSVAIVTAVAAVVAVGWVALDRGASSAPATEPQVASPGLGATPSASSAAPEPKVEAVASVTISITTTPPGARVLVGKTDHGATPFKLTLDKGSDPVAVSLELEGHEPHVEKITPDVDQRIALSLEPLPRGRAAAVTRPPSGASAAPTASGGRYRKFN